MVEWKKLTDDVRPICSCGNKMKLVEFETRYSDLVYWQCQDPECEITYRLREYETDAYELEVEL